MQWASSRLVTALGWGLILTSGPEGRTNMETRSSGGYSNVRNIVTANPLSLAFLPPFFHRKKINKSTSH